MKGIKITNMHDKSNLSKKEKDALINAATAVAGTELIKVFSELGLSNAIECIFEDKKAGNKFLLRLKKL